MTTIPLIVSMIVLILSVTGTIFVLTDTVVSEKQYRRLEAEAKRKRDTEKLEAEIARVKAESESDTERLKAEVNHVRAEAKRELERLKAKIDQAKAENERERAEQEKRLEAEINQVRVEAKRELKKLESKIDHVWAEANKNALGQSEQRLTAHVQEVSTRLNNFITAIVSMNYKPGSPSAPRGQKNPNPKDTQQPHAT